MSTHEPSAEGPQVGREPDGSLSLFADGGEMGERMAAVNWSATPLGPVASWPQSLRTCVRIVLTSRQPMFVWWGDSLINLYNDAYRSILGGKHPSALGQAASLVWREIWDQVGPRAEQSMHRNQGTYDEALLLIMERYGYPEETYYTFSYSPVPNDQGGAGGILCANTDDTGRIIGQRRLALLRELATRTADARAWQEVCRQSAAALATDPRDVLFSLIYIAQPGRSEVVLAGGSGIGTGGHLAPERIGAGEASVWPVFDVMRSHAALVAIDPALAAELRNPNAGANRPPTHAAVVPIPASGETGHAGVLIVGLNPLRPYDDDYRTFLDLASRQIAGAVGNARAYEAEKLRAEQLAELDRAKTAFFSNVSHEFRTPLTLMLGPVEDALASAARSLAGANLATVHRNALRLLKLVNTLLDFARIEAGRAQASYEPTDLSAVTQDLASAFRAAVERAGIRLEVECEPLPESIFVDRDMWERIVLNLLSNAFKFTFTGAIAVGLHWRGDHVALTVRDTGTGIAERELPHLFERFHRVQGARSRTHEGSGIGLALVHELVRLHGGAVRVESRLGEGTTFTVTLPRGTGHLPAERVRATRTIASTATGPAPYVHEALRWSPDEATDALAILQLASPLAARPEASIGAQPDAHILLADDNADMRDYLGRVLRERWSVQAVPDGSSAAAAARERRPDLVLTDVMMPGLDGFGLLRALREDDATRNVPVIMLSARAGEESRVEGLEAGADDYLVKPFSARELVARVSTHLQIARLRTAADRERRRLHDLFMQAPVPVAVFSDAALRFEVANVPFCAMVGRPGLVGRTVREAFPEIGEHGVIASLERVYRTGESERMSALLIPIERDGGVADAYFDYIAQPVREAGTALVTGVMIVAIEVTDQVMARRHVDALRESAESANRAKDEFLAMLGHELRNPLAPISTALHLLRLRDTANTVQKEREVIERQVAHLLRLVDDLLDVSRIARGKIELHRQPVELASVVASAIEVASPLFEERRHHLDVNVPARGLLVEADPTRLAQVVSNLLTNAAKYTPAEGHIAIRGAWEDGEIVLSVRDDGVGIGREMLPRVFDTFVQERQATDRSAGGLGLGLAIVRNLVQLHGGSVSALSEGGGRGSEFIVRLPGLGQASANEGPRAVMHAPRTAPEGKSRRVLVVDDNVDAAEMLQEYLSATGNETRVANDGPEALAVAGEFLPELVLLDIGLPVMDGHEVARRIRDDPRLAGAFLVALTGYGQAVDLQRSKEAGFDEHLVKPVDLKSIDRVLENLRLDAVKRSADRARSA